MAHTEYIWYLKYLFWLILVTNLILTFGEIKGVIGDSVLHIFINGDFSLVISILSSDLPQTKIEK